MINTHPRRQKLKTLSNLEYSALDNDDLLTEILVRAPAKSVIRFRSVCKKWRCIISSDHFCHQHFLRHPKLQPSLLLELCCREFFYFNPTSTAFNGAKMMVPFSRSSVPFRDCSIEQACNGLMLMKSTAGDISNQGRYSVYNPTTGRSRKIALSRNDEYPRFAGIGLAFDPSKSPHYKIVCIYCTNPNESSASLSALSNYEIEVYDSESEGHSWKLVLEASSRKLWYGGRSTAHWNNKIYWMSDGGCYCYFDIDKNEMKSLAFPQNPYPGGSFRGLQESYGHLYHCVDEYSRQSVAVWELVGNGNDDGASPWLFKHRVPIMDSTTKILRFMAGDGDGDGDGDETCSLLTHRGSRKMRVYSFGDGTHEDFLDLKSQPCSQPGGGCFSVTAFHFGETLALV